MTCCHDARSARLHTFAIVTIRAYFVSPQQQAVGRLLAQGMSNQEIARTLVLEPRSVQRNVGAILRKTDCVSRFQAALVVHDVFTPGRDGLMDSFLTRVCTRDYNMSGEVLVAEAGPDCSHRHHQGRTVRRPSRPAIEREAPICMPIFASARSNASRTACITLPGRNPKTLRP